MAEVKKPTFDRKRAGFLKASLLDVKACHYEAFEKNRPIRICPKQIVEDSLYVLSRLEAVTGEECIMPTQEEELADKERQAEVERKRVEQETLAKNQKAGVA